MLREDQTGQKQNVESQKLSESQVSVLAELPTAMTIQKYESIIRTSMNSARHLHILYISMSGSERHRGWKSKSKMNFLNVWDYKVSQAADVEDVQLEH